MMLLEFLAEFNPFLAEHIEKHGNPGKENTSYLSSTIGEEIIAIMAEEVLKEIEKEIQEAKYYAICVDSTPDITHTDQLAFITRIVKMNGHPVERFLGFIANPGHKAEELYDAVILMMDKHNLNYDNCRGQSYDNAANMSGCYSAHSLNLIGEHAAGSCKESRDFFSLQEIYVFFSLSTTRWQILAKHLSGPSVKRMSDTRWSARSEACNSLNLNWKEVVEALKEIEANPAIQSKHRSEASGLLRNLESLETAILFAMWCPILSRFDAVNTKLQQVDIGLDEVTELYNSLIRYIEELRDDFDQFERTAMQNSGFEKYRDEDRRIRVSTVRAGENREGNVVFTPRENFRIKTYLVIIDGLLTELKTRKKNYEDFVGKFSFLLNLQKLDRSEIRTAAEKLVTSYPNDLDQEFIEECIHFKPHISEMEKPPKTFLQMSTYLRSENSLVQVFPYLDIAIRMFLCTFATNCSAERSFSALKRTKTYLRAGMGQDRLNSLAILCIEAELCKALDFELILQKFAEKKARKKSFV